MIPSRESVVNSNGSLEFTSLTVAETRVFTRLGGEVKDSGFQEARTGPTASVSMWTTESVDIRTMHTTTYLTINCLRSPR